MSFITLCADDYGLSPAVSQAICDLIQMGRLQATGCMTISPHWPETAMRLRPLAGLADIGLHLTLTDQVPLGPMPRLAPAGRFPTLGALLKRSLSGRLDRDEIQAELTRQIDAFEEHFGQPPDFLDGHHHIHQLPGIGSVVIDLWRQRLGGRGWIRSCYEPPHRILAQGISPLRAMVISSLGIGFRRQLRRHAIPHNQSFRGVYDFSGRVAYGSLFKRFIRHCPAGCLMMVHPGLVDTALQQADSLTAQRENELAYLSSDQCVFDLYEQGTSLRRMFP